MSGASMQSAKMLNLALRGGGAHAAHTWGVLDRLLEDGRNGVEAIGGTSSGAMNAVVMADGWVAGGIDGARQALKDFWEAVSREARNSPITARRSTCSWATGAWTIRTATSGPT